ncbi:MAG: Ig-like domain-containing protein [Microbacterium sp.]
MNQRLATTTTTLPKEGRRYGLAALLVVALVTALILAFPSSSSAATLGGEPPDFPSSDGPTFTAVAGANTVDGTLGPTPTDGNDQFNVIIPSGLQVTSVSYVGESGSHNLVGCGLTGTDELNQIFSPPQTDCQLSYFLAVNFSPSEETWEVTINVTAVNDAPVALDDAYSTSEDVVLAVPAPGVLGNDVDGDALTATLVTGPTNGEVVVNGDGSFTYTPAADFAGSDSFTYQASDGSLPSNTATVTITVTAVDDAPTVSVAPGGSCAANDRSGTLNLTVADVDDPVAGLTLSATSSNQVLVTNGDLVFGGAGANRNLSATTVSGKTGTAVVTVVVSDGQATSSVPITIKASGNGANNLLGTTGADFLLGQNGDDAINALDGNDLLCGGRGNDTLTGGPGGDRFSGGSGPDTATDLNPAQGDSQDGTIP